MDADYLVCAMSAVMLRQIPVTPAWPEAKRWAIENMPYYSATRPVLQSRTKFWREEKVGMNLQFGNPALEHVWSMADEVKTNRGLIVGTAQPGVRPRLRSTHSGPCIPASGHHREREHHRLVERPVVLGL